MEKRKIWDSNLVILMLGRATSLIGSNMQQFALSLYVFAKTGSATLFATILAIAIIPRIILSPFAGVFGDWFDRKKSIVILDLINGVIIGFMAVMFYLNGELSLPIIYILVVLLEITEIFFNSAVVAVIPSIVDKEDLPQVNSVRSFITNSGNLLAPLVAGVLYGFAGLQVILIINAVSFVISAISEAFTKIPKTHKKPEKINFTAFKEDFVGGIRLIKDNRLITTIICIATMLNFCLSSLFSVGIIYIIKDVLMGTDLQFGIFQAVAAFAMILAPIVYSKYFTKVKIGKIIIMGTYLLTALVVFMSVLPTDSFMRLTGGTLVSYSLILVVIFFVAIIVGVKNISLTILFDKVVPLEYMGRVGTVFSLCVTVSIPIGQLLFGVLFDYVPISIATSMAGIIIFVTIMIFKKALKQADQDKPAGQEKQVAVEA